MAELEGGHMYGTPVDYLGPVVGQRILLCGVGVEAVGLAMAGADVYGLDPLVTQVQAVKDLARGLGLRDRTHLQPLLVEHLAYADQFFDLVLVKTIPEGRDPKILVMELARVSRQGGRAVFMLPANHPAIKLAQRAFGGTITGSGCGWIGLEKNRKGLQSHWSDLNRRPLDYESRALPLSYSGWSAMRGACERAPALDALARIRTATPFGTTPSR